MKLPAAILSLVLAANTCGAHAERATAPNQELNTLLMHATFEIFGKKKDGRQGEVVFGTVFVMGIPIKEKPPLARIVLVTAAHVLEDIGGDQATLMVRRKKADGTYEAYPYPLAIRANGHPLFVRHKIADVAAMFADFPDDVPMSGLPPDFLADDARLENLEVHPGDEAFVLGFPLAASTPGAFPILRTGHIASYPLTPMKTVAEIHFDMFLFGGNSGGPVYFSFSNRAYKNSMHLGVEQGLLGLVSKETTSAIPGYAGTHLNLGIIVPAAFIRETIDMLPTDVTGTIAPKQ